MAKIIGNTVGTGINTDKFTGQAEQNTKDIEQLLKDMADLKYVAIDITKLSCSVGTKEIGSVVKECTISWELNKEPVSQMLDGEAVDIVARSKKFTGLNISDKKTFTLAVTDERGAADSASASINFVNGVYYGVIESGVDVDSATILAMTRKLQSSKAITFTVNAGSTQKIAFAMPTRYGTPNFNVGGFDGGFSLAETISFTNASGYTENYDVWMSDNVGLGDTTVKVS